VKFLRLGLPSAASALIVIVVACTHTRDLPACDDSSALPRQPKDPTAAVVVAAGDIAECPSGNQEATAALVDPIAPDAVLTLGDTVYPNGSLDEFLDCYHPSWGRFRSITRAAVGNHEYHAPHAGPFFAYFCGGSGAPFEGRTSFEIGAWHIIVLNSNCGGDLDVPSSVPEEFGGCDASSPQAQWLKDDLAKHPAHCTLAMWHHPRFSSGPYGSAEYMRDLWRILHDAGVDLVLSGHAHLYERFAPMDADGNADDARGIREIVVGTGGKSPLHSIAHLATGSETQNNVTHGVLRLELRLNGYAWRFIPVAGGSYTDEGDAPCHD
jgi:3',5'-cyclic AMP phosphodiesterase CpdA